MDIDLAALPDDVDTLQNLVRSLAAERASLSEAKTEIERLNLIIKKLQRSQFGRRAERIDDDQLQLGLEDLNTDLARVEASLPTSPVETKTSNAKCERPNLPAHLPSPTTRRSRCSIPAEAAPGPAGSGSMPAMIGLGMGPSRQPRFTSTARIAGPNIPLLTWRSSRASFRSTVIPALSG
jgi:hypothetical protein